MNYIIVVVAAFAFALVLGWLMIPLLKLLKIGQSIRDVGPRQHLTKAGTPTMGGTIFILAALLPAVFFLRGEPMGLLVLFVAIGFASVGFADDFLKVVLKQPLGLKARWKLAGQILVALLLYFALRRLGFEHTLVVPGMGAVDLGLLYAPFIALVLVATTNAVNLSDGVDGLAGGLGVVTLFAGAAIAMQQGQDGVALAALAMVGGLLGFLVFNLHPARVFMGDTGSLAIGGAVASVAVLTKTELLLLLVGGVFVIETLSVIIQVTYFKLTGRRVFLMSPIHHHFELLGWGEWKICSWFWLAQIALAVAGLALWAAMV